MRFSAVILVTLVLATGVAKAQLTLVSQVRVLKSDEASRARPVRLRGVVTVLSGFKSSFFFQDRSAGISVDAPDENPTVHAGQLVEITGVTSAGLFAPSISVKSIRSLGEGSLPVSKVFSYEQLQRGEQDSQWIEFAGIVHSANIVDLWGHAVLRMLIETGGGLIETRVREFSGVEPGGLVDANVRIRGVCATNFNDKRQILGVRVFVSDMSNVRIMRAARDLFARPALAIGDLQRFGPGGDLEASHMVRVRGTATFQGAGHSLYLQDKDSGVLVRPIKDTRVQVGELVEAVGFMSLHERSPTLRDARIRIAGPGKPLIPIAVSALNVIRLKSDGFWATPYESVLVAIQGDLVEISRGANGKTLLLRDGETVFRGSLEGGTSARDDLNNLSNGMRLELRGVCSIYRDENGTPVSFTVMLRDARDLRVIKGPGWLNTSRMLWIASFLLLLAVIKTLLYSRTSAKMAKELIASQQRFEVFLNNCPAIALIKDDEGRTVWMNRTGEQIVGVNLPELKGQTDFEIWPAEVAKQLRTNDLAAQNAGTCITIIENLPNQDGAIRSYLSNKFPFASEGGRMMLGGMSLDITQRVETERLLRRSEMRYRELFEQNPVPSWVYCLETNKFLDVNNAALLHYGYSRREFLALTLPEIEAGDGCHRLKDGSVIQVEIISQEMESNSRPCMLVMANDITQRLVSEEKFRVLFEQSSEAHLLVDEHAQVLDCNPAAVSMLRAAGKEQIVGFTLAQFPKYFDARAENLSKLQEQGSVRFDCTHRRFDGTDLQLEVSLTKVSVARQSLTLEFWHDLTQRKETETRLLKEAMTDPLTGLPNRRHFNNQIEAAFQTAKVDQRSLVLCVCDIDYFKKVNDIYGHPAGDAVLVTVSDFIRNGIRKADMVARIGGDEFCIILYDTTAKQAQTLLGRVRNRIEQVTFGMCPGRPFGITMTFGIAELMTAHSKGSELFEAADQALYQAKGQGRNRIVIAA